MSKSAGNLPVLQGGIKAELAWLMKTHGQYKSPGNTTRVGGMRISYDTQRKRRSVLFSVVDDLRALGMCPKTLRNLGRRHVERLVREWVAQGLSDSTVHNKISILRMLFLWLGKPGAIPPRTEDFMTQMGLPYAPRSIAATRDKSWEGNDVDVAAVLAQIRAMDPRVALQMALQHAFGLRVRESFELQPWIADLGHALDVTRGTKGGKARVLPIDTPEQRRVLDAAKAVTGTTESMIPGRYRLASWHNHYNYVLRCCGVTRAARGVTSHGLRHECLQQIYADVTGQPAPVKDGAGGAPDPDLERIARARTALRAGHVRV